MNREIKFRGLTNNGTWVYGNLIQGKNGACYICSINENPVCKNGDYWYIDSPCYVVIPETVAQFTGLKDIEGKEIYEGDIILGYNNPHVVTFADGAFYLTYKNSSVRLSRTCGALKNIGNIFENPELTQTTS